MPAITPDLGHGASITLGTSSGFVAKIISINWTGIKRNPVETTVLDTATAKTFVPADLYDPGEIEVQMQLDTDVSVPLATAAETITLTFPDGETWSCSGFLTDYEAGNIESESVMTATAKWKLTGAITF